MDLRYERRIGELIAEHPEWSGGMIADAIRKEDKNAPGRSAVYEAYRRIKLGMGNTKGTVSSQQAKEWQAEIKALRRTIEQVAADETRHYEIPCGDGIKFGLIGDSQIGSLYSRLDALGVFYQYLADIGVKDVLHAGDVLDGHRVYKGHEWELRDRGWDEQIDRLQNNYAYHKSITTHFITGNHDASFRKSIGIDVGAGIVKARPDFKLIGRDSGCVTLTSTAGHKWKVMLTHPDGGTAYAISYKLQKTINSLSGGTKPNMIAMGHYHKAEMLPQYRNVVGVQVGCFQSQTPFMRRKPTPAHVGGWLMEVMPSDTQESLCSGVRGQFMSFYEPEI